MEKNKYSHPSPKCSGWQSVLYIMDIYWFTYEEKRKSAFCFFSVKSGVCEQDYSCEII